MYPFVRMFKEIVKFRNAPPLALGQMHVSHHRCWPHDIDLWMELNNGRTLTLYDLGRIPFARRTGIVDALRRRGWGLTVAGSMVRYRRRIRAFERIEIRSRAIGWDDRFIYVEQSMWRQDGECANHAVFRMAAPGPNGIVAPSEIISEIGRPEPSPELPGWVTAWIASENARPWPPQMALTPE